MEIYNELFNNLIELGYKENEVLFLLNTLIKEIIYD